VTGRGTNGVNTAHREFVEGEKGRSFRGARSSAAEVLERKADPPRSQSINQ